ncbi:MAG TPA: hypothetical protein VM120_24280 [Bryobacteraceae bacterium]|nr:hypothetical protein [Bryobacteraceae bacterium]
MADALVQLEVAKQYPDIQLTPKLPLFHRRQLLIQKAEAERDQAATQFQFQQAQAIGELERAVAQYQAAFKAWQDAGSRMLAIQRGREAAARRALAAGEGDRLRVATVRLETITASRAELEALARVTGALAAVEDAMQQPLSNVLRVGDPPTEVTSSRRLK